jgi:hypothetical protein
MACRTLSFGTCGIDAKPPAKQPQTPNPPTPNPPNPSNNSGKVVLFGGLSGPPAPGAPQPWAPRHRAALAAAAAAGFAVVAAPAPVKSLAAGLQHVVMSDGERMWAVGRWLDGDGKEAGSAPFYAPRELLHLPAEGIAKVVAGPHSSGAISGDGRLFLSGKLLDRSHAEAVGGACRVGTGGYIHWGWLGPAMQSDGVEVRQAKGIPL